jgi:hypothetical protein
MLYMGLIWHSKQTGIEPSIVTTLVEDLTQQADWS